MVARIFKFRNLFRARPAENLVTKHRNFINTMSEETRNEVLLFSEADAMISVMGDLQLKKTVFFNDQKHKFFFKKILAREPQNLLNYIHDGDDVELQTQGYYSMFGSLNKLAVASNSQDALIVPTTILKHPIDSRALQTLTAILKNGGRMVLSVVHPTLEYLLYNQNPSETGSPDNTISGYYSMFKSHNLYLEEMTEGCVNQALKPFFTVDGEFDYYHAYKGTPLVACFRLVKFIKK